MSKDEINDFLSNQKIGILSLSENDSSYSIPLAYSYDKENIYLTLGPQGRKMECIQKNKNVCFVVYDQPPSEGGMPEWKSIICNGIIERLTTPRASQQLSEPEKNIWVCRGNMERTSGENLQAPEASCFWKIKIAEISGKQT